MDDLHWIHRTAFYGWLTTHTGGRFHTVCELAIAVLSHAGHGHFGIF